MRILISMLVAAGLLAAQDAKPQDAKPQEAPEAVIIPVKTLSGDSFKRLLGLLSVFNAHMTGDDKLRTIVVYAPKNVTDQIRRVVAELDRPGSEAAVGRNIEMTMTFLRCSTKTPAEQHPLPPDLEPVAKQLRAATQYKDVQVWDIVPLRLQEGRITDENLRLPSLTPGTAGYPNAVIRVDTDVVVRKDSVRWVRFNQVRIGLQIPTNAQGQPPLQPGLTTAGDFSENQKTVLGKISGLDDDSAVFVAISLKVLE